MLPPGIPASPEVLQIRGLARLTLLISANGNDGEFRQFAHSR